MSLFRIPTLNFVLKVFMSNVFLLLIYWLLKSMWYLITRIF